MYLNICTLSVILQHKPLQNIQIDLRINYFKKSYIFQQNDVAVMLS